MEIVWTIREVRLFIVIYSPVNSTDNRVFTVLIIKDFIELSEHFVTLSSNPLVKGESAMTNTLSLTLLLKRIADLIITKVSSRRFPQATTAKTTSYLVLKKRTV